MNETPRDKQIQDLLRTYRDLQGTSTSGTGQRDGSDRILHNPGGQWEKTGCDKLDDLLNNLRRDRPVQWWHVTERYLRCDQRARNITARKTHTGRLVIPNLGPHHQALGEGIRLTESNTANELRIVIETWSTQVLDHEAANGIRYLSTRFPFNNYKWRDTEIVAA